jgi:uncharacterized protein
MITASKTLNIVTAALIIVGGINWGLVGLFSFNLVGSLFGGLTILSRITYVLVGLSALYQVVMFRSVSSCWIEPARSTANAVAH